MKRTGIALVLCLIALSDQVFAVGRIGPTSDAEAALAHAGRVVLYSLEPTLPPQSSKQTLHGVRVLGEATLAPLEADKAINAMRAAMRYKGPEALCFEPRHALRIELNAHTFDYLLCYSCDGLMIYRDGVLISDLPAGGSPEALNALLRAHNLPISTSGLDPRAEATMWAQSSADRRRWMAAMPASIREFKIPEPLLEEDQLPSGLQEALARQFPVERTRILALLEWLGAGSGPWSGFPAYESEAELLLLGYTTADILSAIRAGTLTGGQMEGAARYFLGWDFRHNHPDDSRLIPKELKEALLAHSLRSNDPDKIDRARRAFAN